MRNKDERKEEQKAEGEDEWLSLPQWRPVADLVGSMAQEGHEEESQKRANPQSYSHPLFRYSS
jgi:hypothetical protein